MHRIQIAWFRLNLKSFSTTMNWYLVYCLTAIVYIMYPYNVYYSIIVIILVERIKGTNSPSFSNGQENLAQCKEASLRIAVRGTETRLLLSSKYRNPQDMSCRNFR